MASLLAAIFVVPKNCLEFSCPHSYLPKIPIISRLIQRTSTVSLAVFITLDNVPMSSELAIEGSLFSQQETIIAATVLWTVPPPIIANVLHVNRVQVTE